MKALKNISRIQLRNETLLILLKLYELKGKTFYYDELFKKDKTAFQNRTLETDLIFIAKVFNLNLTDARVKFCSKNNFSPKTKDEQMFQNLKKVLVLLQDNYEGFELIVNEIQNLSKIIGTDHTTISWNKVVVQKEEGLLSSNKTISKRELLEELNNQYLKLTKQNEYEQITLVTNYFVDFINMEVFDNYNDKIALFTLYTMLFQIFPVFKYASFFKFYYKHLKGFEYALEQASYNWDSTFSQTDHLTQIIYTIILESYDDINEMSYQYEFEKDLNKSDTIENSILKQTKLFSKNDLRLLHPTVSDSTIDRTLQRLKDEGKIMPIGAGRSSQWQVLIENTDFNQMKLNI